MDGLAAAAFRSLGQAGIEYCLLRGPDRMPAPAEGAAPAKEQEFDLLVRPHHAPRLDAALARLGFAHIRALGRGPHAFWVAYDAGSDAWLKLDVVTALVYGRPFRTLPLPLAEHCLRTRRLRDGIFALSPECELVTLWLHCLLDKGRMSPEHRARLSGLRREVADEDEAAGLIAQASRGAAAWPEVAAAIAAGDWPGLLAQRSVIRRALLRQSPIRAAWLEISTRLLRRMAPLALALRPTGCVVALLGPDCAGKARLARELVNRSYLPARHLRAGPNLLAQLYRSAVGLYHVRRRRLVIFDRPAYGVEPGAATRPLKERLRNRLRQAICLPADLTVHVDADRDPDALRREVTSALWRAYRLRAAR